MKLPPFVLGLMIGTKTPQPVNQELLEAALEVEVKQGDGAGAGYQSGFRISFAAIRSADRRPEYGLLQNPLLQPGNRVVVTIALQAKPRVLMDGIITHQQLLFSEGNGDATLAIMGRDLGVMLDLEEKGRSHGTLKQAAIVRNILQDYVDWGITAEVAGRAPLWPSRPADAAFFQMGTDYTYLQRLAAANGFIFFIRPGPQPGKSTAYWGPPPRQDDPKPALTVNMGTATNVEFLQFAYDAMAASTASAAVSLSDASEAKAIHITQSQRSPGLAKTSALSANNPLLRTTWSVYAGPDLDSATARAQAAVDRSTDMVVVATGALNTAVYGDLLTAPAPGVLCYPPLRV